MPIVGHVRAGARRYGSLLALPGARGPVLASAAGLMPIGMYTFGIVLLVRDATGSFATAGRIAGAFGLADALGAVLQGRRMDRLGQRRVLRAAAVAHLLAVGALVLAATEGAPGWALTASALAGGGSLPQVPAAMRSLWSALVEDEARRQTAYALVTIVFEVSVVTAPVLVAALSALASPAAAMLAAVGLATAGALGFAATPASRRWRGAEHEVSFVGPLGAAGVRTLFLVLAGFGTAIGVLQVAVPAFAAGRGSAETPRQTRRCPWRSPCSRSGCCSLRRRRRARRCWTSSRRPAPSPRRSPCWSWASWPAPRRATRSAARWSTPPRTARPRWRRRRVAALGAALALGLRRTLSARAA